ncbi:hypothetical protein [Bradymonas sediminis]|uniref:Uncharacterized protein n=1 Tax=Bradymonas sediminis TaxID=1548548 RepID=A0A2Z4FP09_9DELT|nr:hypothetical protein [Bradymonas sediminis]AWV90438.1 hypothetical protein DN745_14305 [Bradymonas sediminis]TDP72176.1 hypothetical protein DFR33_107158 [Bradymonas sediminis]
MQISRYCLRNRLILSLLFIAAVALAACGDNSQIVGTSNNQPTNNKKDTGGGGDKDTGTPDAGDPDTTGEEDAGDPDTTTDPCLQTTPAEAAAFAENYAQALCERVFECQDNPKLALYVSFLDWTSVDNCKESILAGSISVEQARAAATNGTLRLNSCDAATCLPSIASASCDGLDRIFDENYVDEVATCYSAWSGSLAENASCTMDAQCEGHQICERQDEAATCTGTCVDAGLASAGQCGDKTCRADQYCSGSNDICMSRPDIGEPCDNTKVCRANATCQSGTCAAVTSGLQAGQACNFSDKLCSFDLICLAGTCAEAAGVGESCNFVGCQSGLYCSAQGECAELGGPGAACTEDGMCRTNRCVNGSCTDVDALCP